MGLDAAGKTTILYKLKLGEIVTTIPTIGEMKYISMQNGKEVAEINCAKSWEQLQEEPCHYNVPYAADHSN